MISRSPDFAKEKSVYTSESQIIRGDKEDVLQIQLLLFKALGFKVDRHTQYLESDKVACRCDYVETQRQINGWFLWISFRWKVCVVSFSKVFSAG